jgi:hypothetical protein
MCQCPYPICSAVQKTSWEAATSALESPQDLSNQFWGTKKGDLPYTWTGVALYLCQPARKDRQFFQYGRSWQVRSVRVRIIGRERFRSRLRGQRSRSRGSARDK